MMEVHELGIKRVCESTENSLVARGQNKKLKLLLIFGKHVLYFCYRNGF